MSVSQSLTHDVWQDPELEGMEGNGEMEISETVRIEEEVEDDRDDERSDNVRILKICVYFPSLKMLLFFDTLTL